MYSKNDAHGEDSHMNIEKRNPIGIPYILAINDGVNPDCLERFYESLKSMIFFKCE